jgi:hypothetical protein
LLIELSQWGDRVGDHGFDRSPEVRVSFDRPGVVELDGGVSGLDHGVGGVSNDCRAAIARRQ